MANFHNSMPILDESNESRAILASGFRLGFFWIGDRWCHSIDLGHDSRLQRVAVSLEGHADAGRIVSPALQQLQFQHPNDDPDTLQALLVGQSGTHHFSVVLTVSETPATVRLSVEVANRCRLQIHALASTYAVDLPSSQILDASTSGVSWSLPSLSGAILSFESVPPTRTDLREAGRRACHVQACPPILERQPTHCWNYHWKFQYCS